MVRSTAACALWAGMHLGFRIHSTLSIGGLFVGELKGFLERMADAIRTRFVPRGSLPESRARRLPGRTETHQASSRIRLIHPIYLDVPMLVSFAAAVEGGVAFDTEITREHHRHVSAGVGASGRFGLSALFGRIFDGSVQAGSSVERASQDRSLEVETRGHTEASMAILLYDRLVRESGYVVQPQQLGDLKDLAPGTLVELCGTIEKNAVDTMIDYADGIDILANMGPDESTGVLKGPGGGKKKGAAPEPQSPVRKMRDCLNRDRQRTPISNVLLRCSQPPGCTAVVTLRTANLRDLTLSELHKNTVRLVGKVTRVIPEGETMSAFENYGLALLKPEVLTQAFQELRDSDLMRAEFSEVEVAGPAVQVLPLMVFV